MARLRTECFKGNFVKGVRSVRSFTTLRNGQALLVCPFGNGIPTFADRCRGGFKFVGWVRLYGLTFSFVFLSTLASPFGRGGNAKH